MKTYVYVDGESHYIRCSDYWKKVHGAGAKLEHVRHFITAPGSNAYPDLRQPLIRLESRGKFFWDTCYPFLLTAPFQNRSIDGAVYYTDFTGDDNDFHDVCVRIREQGFDPQVIRDRAQLAGRRANRLVTSGILEKPKGVDIGLTVRLLEDGYHGIYDLCYLFTSDVDYLPVIQAIQRIGRKVVLFGFKDGLGANSELEYVPDAFIDLGEYMRRYGCGKG